MPVNTREGTKLFGLPGHFDSSFLYSTAVDPVTDGLSRGREQQISPGVLRTRSDLSTLPFLAWYIAHFSTVRICSLR